MKGNNQTQIINIASNKKKPKAKVRKMKQQSIVSRMSVSALFVWFYIVKNTQKIEKVECIKDDPT